MKSLEPQAGFTLLELAIVLAILAIVTTLALQEVGHVQDQQRFETSQQGLENIQKAILGSPDDRAPDGTLSTFGFVSDMGRLPRTYPGSNNLTLAELWVPPGVPFDLRQATVTNGVPESLQDAEVWVAGGWRGPYIHLPLGADTVRDGWGNDYTSPINPAPPNPLSTGYARLRDFNDLPITSPGQEIQVIRHLGANGVFNIADTGYDRDVAIVFTNGVISAGIKGAVEVRNGSSAATIDPSDVVTVRVFGPDPTNAFKIKVWSTTSIFFSANPVSYEIPVSAGVTAGTRVVRAYFSETNSSGTTSYTKSAIKRVMLRAGVNPLDLTIDR